MTAQFGRCEIAIIRYHGSEQRAVNARLLTPELKRLIERQNIDTGDINCMKWPLFGLSRHAEFRAILLQSDLHQLLLSNPNDPSDDTYTPNKDGFTVWFVVNDASQCAKTRFTRMHLADIQPLMVSEFGAPEYGEALYLCTFKCDRWAVRSFRMSTDESEAMNHRSRSWDPSAYNDNLIPQSRAREIVEDMLTVTGNVSGNETLYTSSDWKLIRSASGDSYVNSAVGGNWDSTEGIQGVGYPFDRPLPVYIDEICSRSSVSLSYIPDPSGIVLKEGRYKVTAVNVSSGLTRMASFVNEYRDDVIAGAVKDIDNLAPGSLAEFAQLVRVPNIIARPMHPYRIYVGVRYELNADGLPPAVFNQSFYAAGASGVGRVSSPAFPDPFAKTNYQLVNTLRLDTIYSDQGEAGIFHIDADNWSPTISDNLSGVISDRYIPVSTTATSEIAFDVQSRFEEKFSSGICDIWFRGWIIPTSDQVWPGGNYLELRLQTDDRGFGFPTTRIHGDVGDWFLGPLSNDSQPRIEASGLAKSWIGEDGRTRLHVGFPFPMPCVLQIVDNESIGTNVWRYRAKPLMKPGPDTASVPAFVDFYGGLDSATDLLDDPEMEIIAYNLTELNNNGTFAGPGYKIPLSQAGFNVLPIGQDKDGTRRPVLVSGFLLMSRVEDSLSEKDRVCFYFSMHNAIDGTCTSPFMDGGEF